MHLRRKARAEKQKAPTFEMMPPAGYLMPGQRQNVQVKFKPTEHVSYFLCSKYNGTFLRKL